MNKKAFAIVCAIATLVYLFGVFHSLQRGRTSAIYWLNMLWPLLALLSGLLTLGVKRWWIVLIGFNVIGLLLHFAADAVSGHEFFLSRSAFIRGAVFSAFSCFCYSCARKKCLPGQNE